jgi:GTP cyclohydrolase II
MFQIKAYRDNTSEFLAIMSMNFFELDKPIVFLDSDIHGCDPHAEGSCYCNNQMVMALKMIYKEGGVVMFSSSAQKDIDGLLLEMKARKLQSHDNCESKLEVDLGTDVVKGEYHTLASIFKDLDLKEVQLIASDMKDVMLITKLGIKITKRVAGISFNYGNK